MLAVGALIPTMKHSCEKAGPDFMPGYARRKDNPVAAMIMVVDDDVHVLHLMELVLKRLQCSVVTIEDPDEAIKLLESVTPDLFILDFMMPNMNGIELCRYIRSYPSTQQTPVVILSAYYEPEKVTEALQAGANAYLPKTALHSELISQIRSLLNFTNVPGAKSSGFSSSATVNY